MRKQIRQIKVLIHLSSGKDSIGVLYLEPEQRLQDLLNDGRLFIPFYGLVDKDKTGKAAIERFTFLNKSAIVSLQEI